MIKRLLTTLIVLLAVISCDTKKQEEEIAQLKKEIKEQKAKNKSAITENKTTLSKRDSLSHSMKSDDYIKREQLSYLVDEDIWLTINFEKILPLAFKEFDLEEYDVDRAIENSYLFQKFYNDNYLRSIGYEPSYARMLLSKIERTPENLDKIFTPALKEAIYTVLRQGNLYKESGAHAIVKALLVEYQVIKNEKHFLNQLYELMLKNDIRYDGDNLITNHILPKASNETLHILREENYTTYNNEVRSTPLSRLRLVYGFWARRHREDNMEYVYASLKELHENVSGEELSSDENDYLIEIDDEHTVSLRRLFGHFNLKKYDIVRSIANSQVLQTAYKLQSPLSKELNHLYEMVPHLDRTPESLDRLLTPELKEIGYSLLRKEGLYQRCGAHAIVQALLMTYQDVNNDPQFLSELYQLANKRGTDFRKAIDDLISEKVSDEVLNTLSDENYTAYTNKLAWQNINNRLFLVYGFWARRHKEGNMAYAYSLLKELHQNVSEPDEEELYD